MTFMIYCLVFTGDNQVNCVYHRIISPTCIWFCFDLASKLLLFLGVAAKMKINFFLLEKEKTKYNIFFLMYLHNCNFTVQNASYHWFSYYFRLSLEITYLWLLRYSVLWIIWSFLFVNAHYQFVIPIDK